MEITFLTLKNDNANLMLRVLQFVIASIRTLRWVRLELERNGNLKYIVEVSVGDAEVLEF